MKNDTQILILCNHALRTNQSELSGSRLFFLIHEKCFFLSFSSPVSFSPPNCNIVERGIIISKSFLSLNEDWKTAKQPPPSVTFCVAHTDWAITNWLGHKGLECLVALSLPSPSVQADTLWEATQYWLYKLTCMCTCVPSLSLSVYMPNMRGTLWKEYRYCHSFHGVLVISWKYFCKNIK